MDANAVLTGDTLLDRMGIGTRKSYYSGRGAKLADVNGKNLIRGYVIIRDELGQKAADEFEKVVSNIRELSACNFIDAMRRFYANNWHFSNEMTQPGNDFDDLPHDEEGISAAFGGIISVMGGMRDRDETGFIKHGFLEELRALKGK